MGFDFDNDRPIYLQIIEYIKKMIVCGYYLPNQKLQSVREFAEELGVNPNTVQKALFELETMGLVFTERTNGKYITADVKVIENVKNNLLKDRAKKFFYEMKEIGLNEKEAIEYLLKNGGKEWVYWRLKMLVKVLEIKRF